MNTVHLHLAISHFPVIGVIFVFVLFAIAFFKKSMELKKAALFMLVLIAVVTLAVYESGESAGETLEHVAGFSETTIENHEEAAEVTMTLIQILGFLSLATLLIFKKNEGFAKKAINAIIAILVVTIGSVGWTANLGGKIAHRELDPGSAVSSKIKAGGDSAGTPLKKYDKDDD